MSYTLNPIMSPRATIPRKIMWILIPVNSVMAARVTSSNKNTRLMKTRTELFTPGSTAFNTRSDMNPRASGKVEVFFSASSVIHFSLIVAVEGRPTAEHQILVLGFLERACTKGFLFFSFMVVTFIFWSFNTLSFISSFCFMYCNTRAGQKL